MSDEVDTSAITIDNLDTGSKGPVPPPPAGDKPAASNSAPSASVTQEATPADASKEVPADASGDDPEKFQKSSDYKRISRQRANAERRAMRAEAEAAALRARLQQTQPPPSKSAEIRRSDFASDQEYQHALGVAEVNRIVQERVEQALTGLRQEQVKAAANQTVAAFTKEAETQAKAAGYDFEDEWQTLLEHPADQMSQSFADYLYHGAENKAALVHHFAENPDDITRISGLHPTRAYVELAKLDLSLGAKPKPNVTKAPDPGPRVGGRAVHHGDWRASNDMEDFAKGFMEEQIARAKIT